MTNIEYFTLFHEQAGHLYIFFVKCLLKYYVL